MISTCMNMRRDSYWRFMRKIQKNVNTAAEGFMGTGSAVVERIAVKTPTEPIATKVIIVPTAEIAWIIQLIYAKTVGIV